MSKNKLVYQNWIVEIGYDPAERFTNNVEDDLIEMLSLDEIAESDLDISDFNYEKKSKEELISAVQKALNNLSEDERELMIRFYFMGESYVEISEMSNRAVYKLVAFHSRTLRKLKKSLALFAKETYQIETEPEISCPICESSFTNEINRLILKRDRKRTWKPVLDKIKKYYGIVIHTPQILIGHEKYHQTNLKGEFQ